MKKILIVDDSLFMRTVLRDLLSERYEIIEANEGNKAIQQWKKENPDLVLLDIIMSDGEDEGVRVLRSIMQADPEARVIMITAVGQKATIEECKRLGARDYIIKPFHEEQVLETVGKWAAD